MDHICEVVRKSLIKRDPIGGANHWRSSRDLVVMATVSGATLSVHEIIARGSS
jgi:hypothetical protein